MTIANGSRHSMSFVAEVTYGTTPSSPTLKALRHTGSTLALTKDSVQSEELRSDRQITDYRHGNKNVAGDINVELSYGSHDDLLEAALCGTWGSAPTVTSTAISASSVDNSFNHSSSGFSGFEAGEKIVVSGFASSANNGTFTVVSATSSKIIVSGGTLVTAAASPSITITGCAKLKSGTTRRSFTFERRFTDITQYLRYDGCEINTLSLSIAPNAMVTGTLGILGSTFTQATSALSGATYASATTTSPFDSFSGVIQEGGSTIGVVTSLELNLNNGMEPIFVIGSTDTLEPSIGRSNLTGTMTVYFESETLMNKFVNETESSVFLTLVDLAGNEYGITLPRVKYNSGSPDVSGEGPVTMSMEFIALLDSTLSTNIRIYRKAAA